MLQRQNAVFDESIQPEKCPNWCLRSLKRCYGGLGRNGIICGLSKGNLKIGMIFGEEKFQTEEPDCLKFGLMAKQTGVLESRPLSPLGLNTGCNST